ncbi:SDR family oxidoreductase [Bacillus salitolerans]|uniref:SDR family oxidoreductase n=1 Tax=Bacillus salitolerans TaxID=1437434 RepID=A0ABW4LQB8_9BACI
MRNKVALITGSASGIGKRIAIDLAKRGYNVVINYNTSQQNAEKLGSYLTETYHVDTLCLKGDVSKSGDCERLVHESFERFGTIDILINNAGPYIHERKSLIDYSNEEWEYLVNGNLNSVFYLSSKIIPRMREQKWGRIINFGFDRAETTPGWLYRSAFASAKVGLVSLTKTLAQEEAPYGITVNMICPGDITSGSKEVEIDQSKGTFDVNTPVGRAGTGGDISRIVSFLCEDESDFITGSIIAATGGKDVLSKVKR